MGGNSLKRDLYDLTGTYEAPPDDSFWSDAKKFIPQVVELQKHNMDSSPVGYARLIKLGVRAAEGVIYRMILRITGDNGLSLDYLARVNRRGNGDIKVLSFVKIPGSERKATSRMIPDFNVEGGTQTVYGNEIFLISSLGFNILLGEIKSRKPSLDYKKAKRAAKYSWRKLPIHEKDRLMSEAAKRLNEKGPPKPFKKKPFSWNVTIVDTPYVPYSKRCKKAPTLY